MNKIVVNTFIFAAGVGVGVLASWKFMKTKYEKIADEEIQSIKDLYNTPVDQAEETEAEAEEASEESEESEPRPELKEYADILEKSGYVTEVNGMPRYDDPFIITPDEYGEYDHEALSLTYYADGILADDWGEVYDIDDNVGTEALNRFIEYNDDSVYVRNTRKKIDYEIVQDTRRYSDVHGTEPDSNLIDNA